MNNFLYNAYINFYKLPTTSNVFSETSQNNLESSQMIGIFDNNKKIWFHAWSMYDIKININRYKSSRLLLDYAINIDKNMSISEEYKILVRSMLVNSKFYITEKKTQLYLLLAVILYLIGAKKWGMYAIDKNIYYFVAVLDKKDHPYL